MSFLETFKKCYNMILPICNHFNMLLILIVLTGNVQYLIWLRQHPTSISRWVLCFCYKRTSGEKLKTIYSGYKYLHCLDILFMTPSLGWHYYRYFRSNKRFRPCDFSGFLFFCFFFVWSYSVNLLQSKLYSFTKQILPKDFVGNCSLELITFI